MRVVFMGTPDFAVSALECIINAGHDVIGVFTQPDKPVGRKQILTPSDVKNCALEHGIDVFQPKSLRNDESFELVKNLDPDVIVVAAYGKILPKNILDYPKYGCINIHGSLLPKYRGSAPIQWSVINGDKETGITIMQMDEGIDTGDSLMERAIPIGINDTAESMFEKLAALGGEMIVDALKTAEKGEFSPVKQDEALSSYAPMLNKDISVIDWNKPAVTVHNLIRGLYSWPVAFTYLGGKKLKILSSSPCEDSGVPGSVISTEPLTVACGEGAVIIKELQLEGKKRMDSKSFLIGHKLEIGSKLGE